VTTVAVDALRIREGAGVAAPVAATAAKGELVYISSYDGPVKRDGVDWYRVLFAAGYRDWPTYPPPPTPGLPSAIQSFVVGYAAAASGGQRYLELLPPRCPTAEPDLAGLARLSAWEQLACFGDRPLTFEGTYGCGGGCGGTTVGDFEPPWLAFPSLFAFIRVDWRISAPPALVLHFRPDSGLSPPEDGAIVRLTGHFSDPASATCTMTRIVLDQGLPVDPTSAELYCRERFVAATYEVIGTDPDYPAG
jgi:hypothetical protein